MVRTPTKFPQDLEREAYFLSELSELVAVFRGRDLFDRHQGRGKPLEEFNAQRLHDIERARRRELGNSPLR